MDIIHSLEFKSYIVYAVCTCIFVAGSHDDSINPVDDPSRWLDIRPEHFMLLSFQPLSQNQKTSLANSLLLIAKQWTLNNLDAIFFND